jgi:adenine-specific DNA methylase/very-short-patch-repair endonuclease
MTKPSRPAVFIEKIFPVTLLNQQVYYEHGGNPFKGLHRWYSRKPLSFSRASVLGSLLPDTVTPEEFEYLLGLNRRVDGHADDTTKLYKTPPSPERIKQVHDLCEQTWGTRTPTVLDAFAGGGSIPFEAVRYGLNVLASDLNPVAVVTMKAAMEYPLKFGPDLQHEIDKWVKWVGDEAEKRLGSFFPSGEGNPPQPPFRRGEESEGSEVPLEKGDLGGYNTSHIKVQNYLWAHTVVCPSCESVVPLSPNWWLYKRPEKQNLHKWCAVKPIPNPAEKRVDFELVKGRKGKGTTIQTDEGDFDPSDFNTISRGVGKCPNCENIIETDVIYEQGRSGKLGHKIYAIAYRKGQGSLEFRLPDEEDIQAIQKSKEKLEKILQENQFSVPQVEIPYGHQFAERSSLIQQGIDRWDKVFNPRQLLTLVTYAEILSEAKEKRKAEHEPEKVAAILTYLAFVLDRCIDHNSRLSGWHSSRAAVDRASKTHALNLIWNYPEVSGAGELWRWCADAFISDYEILCKQIVSDRPSLLNFQLNSLSPIPVALFSQLQTPSEDSEPAAKVRLRDEQLVAQIQVMAAQRNLPYDSRFLPYNKKLVDRAKELRKNMTAAEKKLWHEYLKTLDERFWRQRPIDHFIVDFYCPSRYLVIEVDGDTHGTDEAEAYDAERTQILEAYGLKVLRFSNDEVLNNFEGVCAAIERDNPPQPAEENPPRPPFLRGEGLEVPLAKGDLGGCNQDLEGFDRCKIVATSADNLSHIPDKSVDAIVTDPPYYATIQYSELSDFFYVWQKRVLGDIFPELYFSELTDKDREAVANPSRFRNMGESAEELANRDYEAKMALAFAEYFRVLRDDGVMTVQFNHKDSGAWDVLAKSLIDAGFEITASWAVSTENPQNLHQAQKNSVSSTVLLVCRKRDPNSGSAWWDDLRPELANLVEQRAPEFEANDISGIDLYLSAFGPALNVFSRAWPVLDSSGEEMRPEVAFGEARKAIANYRFRKLLQTDTAGFDPLTQWYILAWDAFRAREFPFDEARQLALAVGGFNVSDLAKTHKLLDSASSTCKLLSPQQRLKKRAFSVNPDDFSATALVDGLHAVIALYLEEHSIDPVRRFLKATGLLSNDLFMRAWEVALKAIPHIGDERKRIPEEKALADLWLALDEIQAKVVYVQPELEFEGGQMGLF